MYSQYNTLQTLLLKKGFELVDCLLISWILGISSTEISPELNFIITPRQMQQTVRAGLQMFDVSSPEGLQNYVTYLADQMRMYSADTH